MNLRILLTGLLIFGLSSTSILACPTGNSGSLAYIRRDNNRCEGLRDRNVSSAFSVVAFFSTNLSNSYPNQLTIRVPGTGNTRPEIIVQSFPRYRLDQLNSQMSSSGYIFNLNTEVLRRADIPPGSLLPLAFITRNSSRVYFPVILRQPSSSYKFVIRIPQRTTLPTLQIKRNGQVYLNSPITTEQSGLIPVTWTFGNAPAGSYELYIRNGEGQSNTFRFEHNRNWL